VPRTIAQNCAVCGASAFIELIKDPAGTYWPAHSGHGFDSTHVCLNRACLESLEKGESLPHKVDGFLLEKVKKSISMARKSGHIIVGQDEVDLAFKSGRGVALVIIAENAGNSVQRLSQKWAEKLDVFHLLDKDALGECLGFGECSVLGLSFKAKSARTEIRRYVKWQQTQKR